MNIATTNTAGADMPRLALLLLAVLTLASMPVVGAESCSLHVSSVDYPAKVDPGQSFQVQTKIAVTCPQSAYVTYLTGRSDLTDSGKIVSTVFLDIGYFANSGGNRTLTAANSAKAPSTSGPWNLVINATIYGPQSVRLANALWPFTIQVGQTNQTETTSNSILTTNSSTTVASESSALVRTSTSTFLMQKTTTETVTESLGLVMTTERFYAGIILVLVMGVVMGWVAAKLFVARREKVTCESCGYKYPRDSAYCPSCGRETAADV